MDGSDYHQVPTKSFDLQDNKYYNKSDRQELGLVHNHNFQVQTRKKR